jgi:hypothetical protein
MQSRPKTSRIGHEPLIRQFAKTVGIAGYFILKTNVRGTEAPRTFDVSAQAVSRAMPTAGERMKRSTDAIFAML